MEYINQEMLVTIVVAILAAKVIAFFGGNVYRMIFGGGYTKAYSREAFKPDTFGGAAGKSAS